VQQSQIATILTKSLHGAAITWIFYDGSRHFILGSRVPAGCGRWSTVSIGCCSGAVSRAGSKELWPGRHDLIAIDGKTSRRTHDKRKGLKALHTLSAYATNARLVLGQLSVPEKTNEITAIPELLDHLAEAEQLEGALEAEVADYFNSAPAAELVVKNAEIEKGHGRIEMRTYTASSNVDWIVSTRSYPGEPRFTNIKTLVKVFSRVEYADRCTFERFYISSAPLDIDRLADGACGHWGVESMHWLLVRKGPRLASTWASIVAMAARRASS
jgi:hypothetical protein